MLNKDALSNSNSSSKKYVVIVLVVVLVTGVLFYLLASTGQIKTPSLTQQPAEVELRTEYKNPFKKNTQYENPFDEYKNPFNNLQ
jgi:flagellar basal body-associated protein FliL